MIGPYTQRNGLQKQSVIHCGSPTLLRESQNHGFILGIAYSLASKRKHETGMNDFGAILKATSLTRLAPQSIAPSIY